MPTGSMNDTYLNKSLQRGIALLNCFSLENRAMSLRELSERLGIHRSSVYRLATNLSHERFLKYDEATGKYSLGLRLFELGAIVVNGMKLPIKARPLLQLLRDQTNETVHLGLLDQCEVVYVEQFESFQSIKLSGSYGSRRPLYSTALGRVLLAGLPRLEAERLIIKSCPIEAKTPYTITQPDDILRRVEKVREQGFAYDDQETEIGLRCIAAPVRDFSGEVVAAAGISGPAFRFKEDVIENFIGAVVEVALRISKEVGGVLDAPGPKPRTNKSGSGRSAPL